MKVLDVIEQRYSVRKYLDRPIDEETLQRVLEAARLAPSASNRQIWRFVVVRDPARRKALGEAAGQPFVGEAPVVIAGCAADTSRIMRCGLHCHPIDLAIALEHIALQAVAEGLGTCWIGAFDQQAAKAAIEAPAEVEIVQLMPLGYPATTLPPKQRLPLDEIVRQDRWG
jgi:nitroreductase